MNYTTKITYTNFIGVRTDTFGYALVTHMIFLDSEWSDHIIVIHSLLHSESKSDDILLLTNLTYPPRENLHDERSDAVEGVNGGGDGGNRSPPLGPRLPF